MIDNILHNYKVAEFELISTFCDRYFFNEKYTISDDCVFFEDFFLKISDIVFIMRNYISREMLLDWLEYAHEAENHITLRQYSSYYIDYYI